MKEQTKCNRMKYVLIGIIIGIVIGIALFYLLMMFRIIRPFMPFGFDGNFTRPFREMPIV